MNDSVTISKSKVLNTGSDYEQLRELGLEHIEKLSSKIWTDYNIHDPGITLMELLCYAITDLGYRTSYDIKDLLADQSVKSPSREEQFYTAREILTCNPVTISDFRKLIIDVEGVKNTWLRPLRETKPPIFLDCENSRLVKKADDNLRRLNLRGLYEITLELDDDPKYGDLNQCLFEIPQSNPEVDKTSQPVMTIGLPEWSQWMEEELNPDQIEWIKLAAITDIDHINFEVLVRIKVGEKTMERTGWIKTDIAISDTTLITSRIEDEQLIKKYTGKLKKALLIARSVQERLHENRNLCEDYQQFRGIEVEEVAVCADIAVEPDANIEKLMAELYYNIKNYLSPEVPFYTLEEMLDRDVATEDIFNGPPLDHGFIDDKDLEKSEIVKLCEGEIREDYQYGKIYVSDLIQIIMDLEGVKAVKNIILASMFQGEVVCDKEEWSLEISLGRFPRLRLNHSDIVFYKENIPYTPDEKKVAKNISALELNDRKAKRSKQGDYDFPVPEGRDRNVAGYTSIQEDLPITYGVTSDGLTGQVTDKRRGQARQLKAYMAFFDQLLANYLAQLANVKNLYSFSSDVKRTYFYQLLYSLPVEFSFSDDDPGSDLLFVKEESPRFYQVVKDFIGQILENESVSLNEYSTFRNEWIEYKKKTGIQKDDSSHFVKILDNIVEDQQTYEDRRNRFLNHLLARFGESFSNYVLLMYSIAHDNGHGQNRDPAELIHDKEEFLKSYPVISAQRGKAFNYRAAGELWNTPNVSGYAKRLSKLLGIEHYNRRSLLCNPVDELFEPFKNKKTGEWWFRLRDQEGVIILKSEGYTKKANRDNGIESVKNHGKELQYYETQKSSDNRYYFNLVAVNGEIIGNSRLYDREAERDRAIRKMISALKGECNKEGFFLVEHILLRPEREDDDLLPVCMSKNCIDCPGFRDPYSFRISLIIPYWPDRFDNMAFRRFFEQTARREAPAHVHLKICWADKPDIEKFEDAYRNWLNTKVGAPPKQSSEALNKLISVMRKIRSVYPVATLHDCDEEAGENPLLLDNTALGTFKPE